MTATIDTFDFSGGLRINPQQPTTPIERRAIALRKGDELRIPLNEHIGVSSRLIVSEGQRVLKYQLLASPNGHVSVGQHAPTSGYVKSTSIDNQNDVVLECDGLDESEELPPFQPLPSEPYSAGLQQSLYRRIAAAGIVGMGGAGFPAHVKLKEGMATEVGDLIVNGVECEPLSYGDQILIEDSTNDLIAGSEMLGNLLGAQRVLLAVNSDVDLVRLGKLSAGSRIETLIASNRYPAGSEKQLIKIVKNVELPLNRLPIHIGVVCYNVATVVAMYRAATLSMPLISRLVTVNGSKKTVAEVPIGLSIQTLLELIDEVETKDTKITTGGMMMGRPIESVSSPVKKTTNEISIHAAARETTQPARACVRCGECVSVCPIKLQPQKLYELSRLGDLDDIQDHGLFDCIECGCCTYICPSDIPLVEHFRLSKAEVNGMADASSNRAFLLQRYEAHLGRQDNATPAERNAILADTEVLTTEGIDDELAKLKQRLTKRGAAAIDDDKHDG